MPLALDENRQLDLPHQRALVRYYCAAGVGGLAVGVHTTQFAIRDRPGLFASVLETASREIDRAERGTGPATSVIAKIAGVCGRTPQALDETEMALGYGYDAALVTLSAFCDDQTDVILRHCREVARRIPIFGFYLQPAVGGRVLSYDFWREFCQIENVVGIKIAPFNRYRTLDVVRAVCDAGRQQEIALYTGNDDSIVTDLLTEFRFGSAQTGVRIVGGLLGHWSVWTRQAVNLLEKLHRITNAGESVPPSVLTLAQEITDANAAFFDARNNFAGCIAGLHEVLRRQGLMRGRWCLDTEEDLTPGQLEEIDRVYAAYPHLNDDEFVAAHLETWKEDAAD